jgi:lipid A disaccharide synthetase
VLPGSRHNEVHKILPDLVTALPLLAERVPGIQALVARAPEPRRRAVRAARRGARRRPRPDRRDRGPRRRRALGRRTSS